MKNKRGLGAGVYIAIMAILLVFMAMLFWGGQKDDTKYSTILSYFKDQKVTEFTLDLGSGKLEYKLKGAEKAETYTVPSVNLFITTVEEDIEKYNEANPKNQMVWDLVPVTTWPAWMQIIPYVLLGGVMLVVMYFVFSQSGGGGKMNSFGKARVKMQQDGNKKTFTDVAGADEEKQELSEIVEFLKSPMKFNTLGAKIPKGVLLVGPPGTGKTLLAKAVAGEAGVPFFSISGSDFVEMYVGVGASRVRDLFEQAKKNAPSIVFIDEIDAVGRQRGTGLGGGHDEREQTLNQLLVEMDGFADNEGVIIIAATNRSDVLDPALLRPGRFDRQVYVGMPDIKGREEILRVHARNKPLAPDVNLNNIARATSGFTGADLENLLNEAALLSARKNLKAITEEDIQEATIKVMAGPEKRSKVVSEKKRKLVAYHEAGHAITNYACKALDPVHQISIIPRGMAGGYTLSLPEDDDDYVTKTKMEQSIVMGLGGRVAERLILGEISTGASSDLEKITNTARAMVTRYGFSDLVGPIVYGNDQNEVFLGRNFSQGNELSESVLSEIDHEVRRIVDEGHKRSEEILIEYMEKLHLVAETLLEFEKIDGATFYRLMGDEPPEELLLEEKIRKDDPLDSTAPAEETKDDESDM